MEFELAQEEPQRQQGQWLVSVSTGAAGPFHSRRPSEDTDPQIWIHMPSTPALVLGSSQSADVLNIPEVENRGIEVCQRQSGGGLVYIDPMRDCWIDLIIPSTSRLFDADIAKAFHWVGAHWAATLQTYFADTRWPIASAPEPKLPLDIIVVSENRSTDASSLLCFAGTSHGEVTIDGRKVVGLSQRRTRTWARIQSIMTSRWDPEVFQPLIAADALASVGLSDVSSIRAGLPHDLSVPNPEVLSQIFMAHLPAP